VSSTGHPALPGGEAPSRVIYSAVFSANRIIPANDSVEPSAAGLQSASLGQDCVWRKIKERVVIFSMTPRSQWDKRKPAGFSSCRLTYSQLTRLSEKKLLYSSVILL
jgi:hypothetical protein